MEVFSNIVLNLQAPAFATVFSPQGQTLSRSIQATLMDGATPWEIPETALCIIRYAKPDGTKGFYDTLEDDSSAYSYNGNVVTFGLATQALTVPGTVLMQLDFYNSDGEKLTTFTFRLIVAEGVFVDSDIASEDFINVLTAKLTEAAEIFQQIKAAYGAPLTANTAADMTDTSRVYVYTGTTGGGFTNGHWYYWDGTAWADGGNYNSTGFTTDTSLSIAGAAADAKATGDAVGDLNRQLSDVTSAIFQDEIISSAYWAIGGFVDTTGDTNTNDTRLHTIGYIDRSFVFVEPSDGYDVLAYAWANGTYLGAWQDGSFAKSDVSWKTNVDLKAVYMAGATDIKIAARKHNNGNMSTSDGETYSFTKSYVFDLQDKTADLQANVDDLNNAIDKVENIVNPETKTNGSIWVSSSNTYAGSGWARSAAIPVKPNTTYTANALSSDFSWFTNENNDNLGKITTNPFTTPEGCTFIKISEHSEDNFVVIEGVRTPPLNYENYPYQVVKTVMDQLQAETDELQDKVNSIPLTSISMFATVGAIGDSYTSGGIYGVTGLSGDAYYKVSWPQILARKCGFEATNYSSSGSDVSAWLSNSTYGLPALEADTAKDLYVITLGINTEKQIADPTANAPIGTTSDIDTSDPTQNGDTFCGHYGRMLSAIIAHAPNAKIILVQPLLTSAEKLTAIANIATLFGIPYFRMSHDGYYNTDFYTDNLHTSHPIALTYAGMALAYERQITKCMIDNVSYFTDFH